MNDAHLTIFDIERAILAGEILERQRDVETLEPKYRIQGRSTGDTWVESIVKMTPTGKTVVLTVYKI